MQLSISNNASSMEKIKNAFTTCMLSSSVMNFSNNVEEPITASNQMNEAGHLSHLMKIFEEKGWAMPKHATRWYLCMFAVVVLLLLLLLLLLLNSTEVLKAEI